MESQLVEIQAILDKFKDITLEELPHTLPPMRNIKHAIDLWPDATLPNMAAY